MDVFYMVRVGIMHKRHYRCISKSDCPGPMFLSFVTIWGLTQHLKVLQDVFIPFGFCKLGNIH